MATIDDIFESMTDSGVENTHDFLIIDPDSREILIPEAEEVFGVEDDAQADRKYFLAPRYVGDDLDLAACYIRVNFRNAHGEEDSYLVQDVEAVGDNVTFSWELSHKVTAYKGKVQFLVCASFTGVNGITEAKWHTTLATGLSLEGLDPDDSGVVEATSDVIAQLLALVDAQTAAVEAEGDAQIERIQEQFDTFATKTEAANTIKGNLSGAVVFADDVSPVEHKPTVKVHGKNLLKPEPGAAWQCAVSVASDGKITLTNTETDGVAFARVGTLELKKGKTYVYTRYDPNNITNVLIWKTGTTTESWYPVNGVPYTAKDDVVVDVVVYMADISAVGNTSSIYIQIEEGTVATEYEPYIDPTTVEVTRYGAVETDNPMTYIPAADGTVPGVTSLSPYMTILTDTEGVTVECEYNQDTEKAVDKKIEGARAPEKLVAGCQYASGWVTEYFDDVHHFEPGARYAVRMYKADGQCATARVDCLGTYQRGDADLDGRVSVSDQTVVQNITAGKAETTPTADADGDGRVSISDLSELSNIIGGVGGEETHVVVLVGGSGGDYYSSVGVSAESRKLFIYSFLSSADFSVGDYLQLVALN